MRFTDFWDLPDRRDTLDHNNEETEMSNTSHVVGVTGGPTGIYGVRVKVECRKRNRQGRRTLREGSIKEVEGV